MSSELLYTDSSFSWLANEIHIAQVQRDAVRPAQDKAKRQVRNGAERQAVPPAQEKSRRFEEVRIPAGFSVDQALLNARHLRALQLGEYLGSFAKAISDSISRMGRGLIGSRKGSRAEGQVNFDAGTRHESQRKLSEAFLEA